ncbi:MAG TPA: invasin domain 3-containing protein [Anaeromyxobacter sp.]
MKMNAWTVAAAASILASFAACKKSSDSGGGTIVSVGITASKKAVVANGTNSITLTVTDNSGGTVSVSTNRGTFSGGGGSATVTGPTATLTLITCNASADPSCAGVATVTAIDGTASAQATITFGTLASACLADCTADAACPTHACVPAGGGTGTCSGTSPSTCVGAIACTPTETTEATCNDGKDNDCNGDVDCGDAACDNQQCKAGSPTFLCKSGSCVDTVSGLGLEVTPARTRMPANGTATTAVTVKVTSGGQPAGGMGVTVSTTSGSFGLATTGTTNTDGIATFTFTASDTPGVATLTASLSGVTPAISDTATVTFPALGALQIPEAPVQFPVQGAKGSGFQEFGSIAVLVKDDTGQAYPDGLAVRFEHRPLGGSTLGAPLVACVPTDPGCVAFQGATSSGTSPADTVGIATGFLYSGTIAGTLVTTATATVSGVTRTITLPTVAVVGARANAANFSVVCSPRNLPALAETDCAVSLVDAPFTCEALLKDRYDNVLGTATQVIFMSEAASVGKVTTTPAYDPANPAPDLGIAAQIFNTLGAGLPFDVAPIAGEPFSDLGAPDACGVQVHNPRDGLVTIVAIADGEEAFFDSNGNGVYDLGEPFVDLGEPFVDQNDNGQWDPGEWFLDVNGNGAHDGPNGVWDAATKIWTQTVVVYTGTPARMPSGTDFLGTRWSDTLASACTPTPDPAPFAVLAAQAGPPPVPATSQTYFVFASDENLNLLDTGTKYGVDVAVGTIKTNYLGLGSVADDLGLFYRFWPCDQTGACASQCRATGAANPCVMTPSILGFQCGLGASVIITGGATADPGIDVVRWNVSTPYSVFGTGKTALGIRSLTGTNL